MCLEIYLQWHIYDNSKMIFIQNYICSPLSVLGKWKPWKNIRINIQFSPEQWKIINSNKKKIQMRKRKKCVLNTIWEMKSLSLRGWLTMLDCCLFMMQPRYAHIHTHTLFQVIVTRFCFHSICDECSSVRYCYTI